MALDQLFPYLVSLLGLIIAITLSARSELATRAAKAQVRAEDAQSRADMAKSELITTLQHEIDVMKGQLDRQGSEIVGLKSRIGNLEISEELCQRERVALLSENASLRREGEASKRRLEQLMIQNPQLGTEI